jgi:GalNAc-alpha-(1->4)-GalNAc-alpha-(1->3)-diNAcBac-PP-undecaprenol alpha-1,4-N-acetyl-D-galactosaminyltransferase
MHRRADFSAELILICNSLDAGGIERVVSTLANEWSRRGRKVCVITMHDRRRFFALDPAVHHVVIDRVGVTWLAEISRRIKTRLGRFRLPKSLLLALLGVALYHLFAEKIYRVNFRMYLAYEAWALRRALRRVKSPVVVSLGTSVNIVTLKACRGLGRRVIISERNDPRRLPMQHTWNWIARKLYRRADVVTANTRTALQDLREYVEPGKLAFVPNPLVIRNGNGRVESNGHAAGNGHTPGSDNGHAISGDDDRAGRNGEARASVPAPFILIVGRLVWDKSHDVLLEAFALLGEEFREWRLAVVGDGRLAAALRAQAAALGITGRVDWHGVVKDPHVFYRAASIFALPSRVEGTPNALLEAMSCGLPVVISDGPPGPRELVADGETGLVVPVNDAHALAGALRRLAHDDELRRRMGEAGRERVREYELPRALAAWEAVVGLAQ